MLYHLSHPLNAEMYPEGVEELVPLGQLILAQPEPEPEPEPKTVEI